MRPSSVVCKVLAVSKSQRGGEPVFLTVDQLQIRAAAQTLQRVGRIHWFAQQNDGVALVLKPLRGHVFGFVDESDHGNRGRGVDGAGGILIVKRAIASSHRRVKSPARLQPDRARIP